MARAWSARAQRRAADLPTRDPSLALDPSLVCLHSALDHPGGPTLRVFDASPHAIICYGGWLVCLGDDAGITYAPRAGQPQVVALEHLIERVALPLHLLWRGPSHVALHGSAIGWAGRAWALLGDSGVGKSTSAHAMIARGARLLTDDLCLIDADAPALLAGAPTIRLWRDVLPEALRHADVTPDGRKRWFRLPDAEGAGASWPLAGVIVLTRDPAAPETGRCAPLRGAPALVTLLSQCFDLDHPPEALARARLRLTAQLARGVPMWRCAFGASPHGHPAHLDALCALLEAAP